MPGFVPALNRESLDALRRLVQSMQQGNGKAVPMSELVQLAEQVKTRNGITIDFEATEDLGSPLVVVQVPEVQKYGSLFSDLSKREQDVASLIAKGHSNKQIAKQLHITQATVKDHVHRILAKTAMPNRTSLALAVRSSVAK